MDFQAEQSAGQNLQQYSVEDTAAAIFLVLLIPRVLQTGGGQEVRAIMAGDTQRTLETGVSCLFTLTPVQDAA